MCDRVPASEKLEMRSQALITRVSDMCNVHTCIAGPDKQACVSLRQPATEAD